MERVSVTRGARAFVAALGLAAAAASAPTPPTAPPTAPARGPAKTRAGSVLKSDKLLPARIELRGEAERLRDTELRTHFSRIAELDVIAAIAAAEGDLVLQEHVEQVRRKEVQRHQKAMMRLRRETQRATPARSEP